MIRRRHRSDGNSKPLDERAAAHGMTSWPIERPLDRLWGLAGVTALAEFKNPETGYGRKGLSPSQREFRDRWRGGPIFRIDTVEDVDRAAAEMRRIGRLLQDRGKSAACPTTANDSKT